MYHNVQVIAEVKTESPFGFRAGERWYDLFRIARDVGDIISIHTDPRWGGSLDLIRAARRRTNKPILAKGIHLSDADVEAAVEAGANYVLVVGRVPQIYSHICLIEPFTVAQLADLEAGTMVVWNTRDLSTGGAKTESFEQARAAWPGWLCQASNIGSVGDIKEGADAILVGSLLEEFAQSLRDR